MNDDMLTSPSDNPFQRPPLREEPVDDPRPRDVSTLGTSTLYKLCEEMISLRERNARQHQLVASQLSSLRDDLKTSWTQFADVTQRAYQQFRKELHGEKRVSLALLNELLELGQDLESIVAARPAPDDKDAVVRWADAVEIESRKVQSALARHGILPYDAVIGSAYNPALHERVGSKKVEGMAALLIAEQRERGYASQQPEFVLRRPKVIVSD
jgi:molecular chaperone GrpE (heat shock protein)